MGRISSIAVGNVFDEAGHGWRPGSSFAIEEDGTAWVWGFGFRTVEAERPVQVHTERPVLQVTGSYLLTDDGLVRQINFGGTTEIAGLADVTAIHELWTRPEILYALKADGTVWCREGETKKVSRLGEFSGITAMYGSAFSLFLQESGGDLLYVTGGRGEPFSTEGSRVPLSRKAVQVAADYSDNALILDEAGEVFRFTAAGMEVTPLKQAAGAERIAYSGEGLYLFVKKDGTVWGFGENKDRLLGGEAAQVKKPVQIPGLSGIVDVRLGTDHALALDKNGVVYSWGSNMSGQLGRLDLVYNEWSRVGELTDVRRAIALNNRPYFIREDGSLWGMAADRRLLEISKAKGTTELVEVNGLPVTLNEAGEVRLWKEDFASYKKLRLSYPVKTLAADNGKLIVLGRDGTLEVLTFEGKRVGVDGYYRTEANKLAGREKVSTPGGAAGKIVSLHATPYVFMARTEDGQVLYTTEQADQGYTFHTVDSLPPIKSLATEYFIRNTGDPQTVRALDTHGNVHEILVGLTYKEGRFQSAKAIVKPIAKTEVSAITGRITIAADGTTQGLKPFHKQEQEQERTWQPISPIRLITSVYNYNYRIEVPGSHYVLAVGYDNQISILGYNPFGGADPVPQPVNVLKRHENVASAVIEKVKPPTHVQGQ